MPRLTPDLPFPSTRTKLLDVAVRVVRQKGYNATTVDELCAAADVTKGAFFHHSNQRNFGGGGRRSWLHEHRRAIQPGRTIMAGPIRSRPLLGYIDMRVGLIGGTLPAFTCFVGTLTQEVFLTHKAIRDASSGSILGHAQTLEERPGRGDEEDTSLRAARRHTACAIHTQARYAGALLSWRRRDDDPPLAVDSIRHLRRYSSCFWRPIQRKRTGRRLKLYYSTNLNPRVAVAVARHLNSPVEFIRVSPRDPRQEDAFRVINPNTLVPVLVEGDKPLWETDAIACRLSMIAGSDFWPTGESFRRRSNG